MKKKALVLLSLLLLILPLITSAQAPLLNYILLSIKTALWYAFTILIVISFLVAAILYVTAAGDPARIERAKKMTVYGVVAIVIALLAYSALIIIRQVMGL